MSRVMKVFFCVFLLVAILVGVGAAILRPPEPLQLPERGAVIRAVTIVIPGESRSSLVDVVVVDNAIASIRPSSERRRQGFILPGLSDAHMHNPSLPFPGQQALIALLNLRAGVTHVRMAAGDAVMRDAIAQGQYPGPRILSCGPFNDGDPPQWPNSNVVVDASSAVAAVKAVEEGGYDCVKVYNELTAEASAALYEEARRRDLAVIGHIPWRQSFVEAHIDDVQHVAGWAPLGADAATESHVRRLLALQRLDSAQVQAIAQISLAQQRRLTPTLITLQRKFGLGDIERLRESEAALTLPRYYRQNLWDPDLGLVSARLLSDADRDQFRALFPRVLDAVRVLHQVGVEFHTGTDAPAEFIVPGAGLLEELNLFRQAGLSSEEVLAISTVTTPRRLWGSSVSRLVEGSPADFVVYKKDPTLDLAYLDTRLAVVADGRYYSSAELEQQLEDYQAWFNGDAYRRLTETMVGMGLWLINNLSR